MTNQKIMEAAINEAMKGDYPIGAVITRNNKIIVKACNKGKNQPILHAEVNAIKEASIKLSTVKLTGCTLYSTCEPCPMCFFAAWWAKIDKIVYGVESEDVPKNWNAGIKCFTLNEESGNRIKIVNGVLRNECLKLLR